jgi:aspartate racemase
MKIVGLIGGISWTSTAKYYQLLNEEVHQRLGGIHSSKILMYSLDLQEYADFAKSNRGNFEEFKQLLVEAAGRLERAGVDFLVVSLVLVVVFLLDLLVLLLHS